MFGKAIPAVEMAAEALASVPEEQRIAFAIRLVRDIYTPSSAQHPLRLGRTATDRGGELVKLQFLEGCG